MKKSQKKNIAILTGGNVAERGISLQSAKTIEQHLSPDKYNFRVIELNGQQFVDQATGLPLDMNDFSLRLAENKITFDLVFLMLHGHPAEDGSIIGYFDLLQIPVTGSEQIVAAITFNKQLTKAFLRPHGIPMADSQVLRTGEMVNIDQLATMGFPLFVKPNQNGSSYGVSKVEKKQHLSAAIEQAFRYDQEVIVEQFISGVEMTNGVFRKGKEIIVLPVTEIRTSNQFFDYQAKYENASEEITPAELSKELTQKCQEQTRKIYQLLGCKGMARADYILMNNEFYFLEINTIPGMSPASLIPQQVRTAGIDLSDFLDAIIDEALVRTD